MAWEKPITNWEETLFFNKEDYNRIIGNIAHLKGMAVELFQQVSKVDLGEQKDYESMIYAREINAIEKALEALNLETYQFEIGETKEYAVNGRTPLGAEFARIESAILLLYNTMTAHKAALPRLGVRLGNQKGLKV